MSEALQISIQMSIYCCSLKDLLVSGTRCPAHHLCGMYSPLDCGAHVGLDDFHLHPPQCRGRGQSAFSNVQNRFRIPPHEDERNCWTGLGLFNCAGNPSFPSGNRHSLLGEILQRVTHLRLGSHGTVDSHNGRFHSFCRSFLFEAGRAQIGSIWGWNQRIRVAQRPTFHRGRWRMQRRFRRCRKPNTHWSCSSCLKENFSFLLPVIV